MKHIVLVLIVLMAAVVFVQAGEPNIRLVHPLGEDEGNTCIDIPCRTIGRAIEVSVSGDIVDIAAGEYTEKLLIDKSLRLQGAGQDNITIIQAHENNPLSATGRVITISGKSLEVEISDLTIRHGRALGSFPDKDGGGLFIDDSALTLTNVTFSDNVAFESTSTGGGIWARNSELVLNNVIFDSNHSGSNSGGVNLAFGNSAEFTGASFIDNTARNLGGGIGMGQENALALTNVDFMGNSAISDGGGMYASGTAVELIDVDFLGNSSGFRGGGLTSFSDSMTLTRVTFDDNSAPQGGGMYSAGLNASVSLNEVSFDNNEARQGGGMYSEIFSTPELTAVTFTDNRAVSDPGNRNLNDGDIVPQGDDPPAGGGMFNASNSSPSLGNVTFSGNSASVAGGGMYNFDSAPSLVEVIFDTNLAGRAGGGMFNGNGSVPVLLDVDFRNNTAVASGGGMVNDSGSAPVLTNVMFRGNAVRCIEGVLCSGGQRGGGMYNSGSDPVLTNVTFSGNLVFGFLDTGVGGGMSNVESAPRLTNVTFSGNRATGSEGGVGGGMFSFNESSPLDVPAIRNSVFWNNQDESGTGTAGASIATGGAAPAPNIAFSLVQGALPSGDGNLDGTAPANDPLFLNMPDPESAPTLAGNLRLRPESPVIDVGNNAFVDGIDTDLAGNPRIIGLAVDLGPYEFTGEIDDVIFRDRFEK